MRIRHAHYSLLGSTSTAVLLSVVRALLALLRGTDVLTLTEVGTGRRAAVLGRLPGYQLVWLPGPTGQGECALLFARWKWRLVEARTTQLSTSGVPRRGGQLVHSLDTIIEHRRSLARHLFSTAHLPSAVEGRLRWSTAHPAQVAAHQQALRAWADNAARWRAAGSARSPHPGRFAGVHLVADWNLDWNLDWVRSLLTDLFPGFTSTWAGRTTGVGTHGTRFIDYTLTTCGVARARVLRLRTASDHRPFRNVLTTRQEAPVTFPAPSPIYLGPPSKSSAGSNKPIKRIVIHSTVSPCRPGQARKTAAFFRSEAARGSAHYAVDPAEVVQCGFDSVICWHAPPNPGTLGVEMCEFPAPDKTRWSRPEQQAMLKRTARLTAELCLAYDVPPWFRHAWQLKLGARGVTTHAETSKAFKQSSHWDPGAWPRFRFMRMVRAEIAAIRKAAAR